MSAMPCPTALHGTYTAKPLRTSRVQHWFISRQALATKQRLHDVDSAVCTGWRARRASQLRPARAKAVVLASTAPLTGVDKLETVGKELQHPLGKLTLRPVSEEDVKAATVVLTRAFATTGYLPLGDAGQYCKDMLQQPPNGILLVARLVPQDAALLPEGQSSRLIGTVALSFSRNTREEFPTLQPPDEAVYLSNLAVCPSFRRQGVAQLLLQACEELCQVRGFRHIFLHVRLGDTPAQQLYEKTGYQLVDSDSFLVKLRGIMPRSLLAKELPPRPLPS